MRLRGGGGKITASDLPAHFGACRAEWRLPAAMVIVDPPRDYNFLERRDFLRRHRTLLVGLGRCKGAGNGRLPADEGPAVDDQVHLEARHRTPKRVAAPGRGVFKGGGNLVPRGLPLRELGEEHGRLRRREVARLDGLRHDRGQPGGFVEGGRP